MSKIKKYENFLENQIIDYISYSVNESVDINSIWNKVVDKITNLSNDARLRVAKHLMATLLTFNSATTIYNMVNDSNVDSDIKKIAVQALSQESKEKQSEEDLSKLSKEEENNDSHKSSWKKGYEFSISKKGIDHIKDSEKLKLKAYSIGDGKITIGYGHAEPVNKSRYKIGDRISEEEAEQLLRKDLKTSEDGVRRVFHQWEEKQHNILINQDMYDAMVSLAYNSGVESFRKGQFLQELKKGNFEEAGEKIKNFNISKKYPGLAYRRDKESKLFLKSI